MSIQLADHLCLYMLSCFLFLLSLSSIIEISQFLFEFLLETPEI